MDTHMEKFAISYWECLGHTDLTEGRGPMFVVCGAGTEAVAKEIIQSPLFYEKYGVMGGNNCSVRKATLTIYYNYHDWYNDQGIEEKRKRALAKLSRAERDLLGLK